MQLGMVSIAFKLGELETVEDIGAQMHKRSNRRWFIW